MDEHAEEGAYFVTVLILIVPLWRICKKAGYHPAISLLSFLPGLGLIILSLVLAFGQWPALKQLTKAKR